jgi:hypothetical protein
VRFWDSSAIVPLLVLEESSRRLQSLAAQDSAMLVWWGSAVECVSALARRERDGTLDDRVVTLPFSGYSGSRPIGTKSIPAMPSGKRRLGLFVSIPCVPRTHFNLPRHM